LHKPFSFEAAKAGEPVELQSAGTATWEPCHFVGRSSAGAAVIERGDRSGILEISQERLRMAAKKVTVRYRVAVTRQNGWPSPVIAQTNEQVGNISASAMFVQWIHTDWQEVEIPQ